MGEIEAVTAGAKICSLRQPHPQLTLKHTSTHTHTHTCTSWSHFAELNNIRICIEMIKIQLRILPSTISLCKRRLSSIFFLPLSILTKLFFSPLPILKCSMSLSPCFVALNLHHSLLIASVFHLLFTHLSGCIILPLSFALYFLSLLAPSLPPYYNV